MCCSYFCVKKHLVNWRFNSSGIPDFIGKFTQSFGDFHDIIGKQSSNHHVSGDMLNLRGVRRRFCMVEIFFVQKDCDFCFFWPELRQILTKKCSEMKNKRFFPILFLDYKLRPKPGVNSGILKNRQNHTIGMIFVQKTMGFWWSFHKISKF